ncbi:hypothetical protein DDB_G0278391 [Dictyostelium discoideum AX4]|uniref:Transmembrane protein n=1 Tax=Dictyostelium discoideum TaxID=44689 RepID=Q54Y65_DICDI|nr:hypothetical protein DDB_G0278391 [Dictyostelium discoideum AX4]EAL68368.2 hypothetical protein DDB_G0278391 [Dictyostelium discoideum AX4]|eukprot:XP_642337.2 hypothetical protein DDB_G0278391 [Dictyostelium discoideum AX4]
MNRKLILFLLSFIFINFVKCGYIHMQMFADADGLCKDLFIGAYVLEGVCIENVIMKCSTNQKSVLAYQYENDDCSGPIINHEELVTGGCVNVSSKFECTEEIDLPQDTNTIIIVSHNSTQEECPDYKQGLVKLSYQMTNLCLPNIIKPNQFSTIQTCDETSITQTNYQSRDCNPSTKNQPNINPLPVNDCKNSTNYLSTYQFCYIPSF